MKRFLAGAALAALTACGGQADLDAPPVDLGDFRLSHNIAVASKATQGPLSRPATEDQLVAAVQDAMAERFGKYEGDRLYHFGVSVEAYVLAPPGVPIVASPKSILIVNFTLWDDAAQSKMNETPHQITVLESLGTQTIIGSGYTLTPEEQLQQLAQNAAKSVETYLIKQRREQGWFGEEAIPAEGEAIPVPQVEPVTEENPQPASDPT